MYKQVYYFQFIEIIKKTTLTNPKAGKTLSITLQLSIKYLLLLSFKLTSLWLSRLDSSGTFYHLNQLSPVIYG